MPIVQRSQGLCLRFAYLTFNNFRVFKVANKTELTLFRTVYVFIPSVHFYSSFLLSFLSSIIHTGTEENVLYLLW